MKKIFDVNALDLAKVGKAFGFAVPPRVNVNIGEGKSSSSKLSRKRPRSEDEEVWEEVDGEGEVEEDEDEDEEEPGASRDSKVREKARRVEALGRKAVAKEVYKKGKERKRMAQHGTQWSR